MEEGLFVIVVGLLLAVGGWKLLNWLFLRHKKLETLLHVSILKPIMLSSNLVYNFVGSGVDNMKNSWDGQGRIHSFGKTLMYGQEGKTIFEVLTKQATLIMRLKYVHIPGWWLLPNSVNNREIEASIEW
ncbi:uncharacterized protein DS421_13g390550 [Arachis hypogaea]|nr:uncharacterized protein DS421_13g390550 [Arachis hypogaea]